MEWTEENLRPLYQLFVGDSDKVPEEQRKKSADLRMRIILLQYLQKPHIYCWPECIQVCSNFHLTLIKFSFQLSLFDLFYDYQS